MGREPEFVVHPEVLKWPRSYWRHLFVQIEEEAHGMAPGRLVDLVLAVQKAEADARWPDYEGHHRKDWWPETPATQIGRAAIIELHLREFGNKQIDDIFGFAAGTAAKVIASHRFHPRTEEVIAAHQAGHPPSRISRDCRVGMAAIHDIVRLIGEQPHLVRNLARSADINHSVKRLYEDGYSYREIATRLGITEDNVRQRLQYMRRKGRIDQPPRDGGRRGPAA